MSWVKLNNLRWDKISKILKSFIFKGRSSTTSTIQSDMNRLNSENFGIFEIHRQITEFSLMIVHLKRQRMKNCLNSKVGCIFPMVMSSEFWMMQYRYDDNREDACHFTYTFWRVSSWASKSMTWATIMLKDILWKSHAPPTQPKVDRPYRKELWVLYRAIFYKLVTSLSNRGIR